MLHYLNQHSAPAAGAVERVVLANVSRRAFLKSTAWGTGAVIAASFLPAGRASALEAYHVGGLDMPHGLVTDPHVFVSIAPDGTVTIVAHRSEMGTGSRTSLPMVIADEMEADWARVAIVQAPGDEPKYGNQDTDGSRSMRHHIQSMRQIGATLRAMLREAAAKQWGVDVAEVEAVNHEVLHASSGRKLGYGDLAEVVATMEVPGEGFSDPAVEPLRYKDESEFRYIGKGNVSIYDLHDITTGKAVYGADVRLPGMKYAVIARPPVVGGKVRSVDDSAARAVAGVERIVQLEGSMPPAKFAPLGGVAVVASSTWAALQGRDALQIEWDDGPHGAYDSEQYHPR